MGHNIVSVNKMVIKDKLKYNGETLLTYRIEYPEFRSTCYKSSLLKVNKYYKDKALEFQKYCENELFRVAIKQYHEAIENNFPIRVFDALLGYEMTYSRSCIISIYVDRYEYTGGAHGNTIRESETWNLEKCGFVNLSQIVCCFADYKAYILAAVQSRIEKDPDIYFEDYNELIERAFNDNSFYCRPEGIVVYYQLYDIAPYSSGIREFLLPYTHCVINPEKLCCLA